MNFHYVTDEVSLLMLDRVQDTLGRLNCLPPRGCFFDDPRYLDDLVTRVRSATSGDSKAGHVMAGARHR